MKVYALWHSHELHDDYGQRNEEKLIGIYSAEEHRNGINKSISGFHIGSAFRAR
jgi:hypothetical protein